MTTEALIEDSPRLSDDPDWRHLKVYLHLVNRADSGSPQWMAVRYADKQEAEDLPKREETCHRQPAIMDAWHNTTTGMYFDFNDRTKPLEVVGLGL